MSDKPKLTIVQGDNLPRAYEGKPLECECGSRTTIETRIDRRMKDGVITDGVKQINCFHCKAVIWTE